MSYSRLAKVTRFLVLIACLAIVGCSSVPARKTADAEFDANDKGALLDQLGISATSTGQAIEQGDAALRQEKYDLALMYYIKALEMDDKNVVALEKLADVYTLKGEVGMAAVAYQMILKIDARHAEAHEKLGLLQLKNRQYDGAQKHLTQAVKSDPRRWLAQNGLGLIADLHRNYKTAIQRYSAALEVNPNSPMLLNNLGYSLYLSGDQATAKANFLKALSINPNYQRALHNLALLEAKQGNYQRAVKIFNQFMEEAAAYNNVGYICMMEGKFQQAEQYFIKALKLSPIYYAKANENLEYLRTLLAKKQEN